MKLSRLELGEKYWHVFDGEIWTIILTAIQRKSTFRVDHEWEGIVYKPGNGLHGVPCGGYVKELIRIPKP